jgi:hypothetical protein
MVTNINSSKPPHIWDLYFCNIPRRDVRSVNHPTLLWQLVVASSSLLSSSSPDWGLLREDDAPRDRSSPSVATPAALATATGAVVSVLVIMMLWVPINYWSMGSIQHMQTILLLSTLLRRSSSLLFVVVVPLVVRCSCEFVDGQTIGQLTGEFVDGQTIVQFTGEFVDGQTIVQPTGKFVGGQTIVQLTAKFLNIVCLL